jgi:hypothetical protein
MAEPLKARQEAAARAIVPANSGRRAALERNQDIGHKNNWLNDVFRAKSLWVCSRIHRFGAKSNQVRAMEIKRDGEPIGFLVPITAQDRRTGYEISSSHSHKQS